MVRDSETHKVTDRERQTDRARMTCLLLSLSDVLRCPVGECPQIYKWCYRINGDVFMNYWTNPWGQDDKTHTYTLMHAWIDTHTHTLTDQ